MDQSGIKPYKGKPDINRLINAMRRQEVDRVPHVEILIEDKIVEKILGKYAGNTLAFGADIGKEMADPGKVRPMQPNDYIDICNIIGQDTLVLEAGWTPFKMEDMDGKVVPVSGKPISSRNDFNNLIMPSDSDIELKIGYVKEYKDAVKGTGLGVGITYAWFVLTIGEILMNLNDFMTDIYEDLAFIEYMFEVSTEYWVKFSRRLVDENIDWVVTADDLAFKSGLFIPPKILKKIWFSRYRRIMEPIKEADIPILFHSDGKIDEIMPWIIDFGIDAVNPMDPYCIDYRDYKKRFGKNIALWGNIDVEFPLSKGTPQEVERDVKEHMDILKPGYGYICSSSHSIVNYIPYGNFTAFINSIHKYGDYND